MEDVEPSISVIGRAIDDRRLHQHHSTETWYPTFLPLPLSLIRGLRSTNPNDAINLTHSRGLLTVLVF